MLTKYEKENIYNLNYQRFKEKNNISFEEKLNNKSNTQTISKGKIITAFSLLVVILILISFSSIVCFGEDKELVLKMENSIEETIKIEDAQDRMIKVKKIDEELEKITFINKIHISNLKEFNESKTKTLTSLKESSKFKEIIKESKTYLSLEDIIQDNNTVPKEIIMNVWLSDIVYEYKTFEKINRVYEFLDELPYFEFVNDEETYQKIWDNMINDYLSEEHLNRHIVGEIKYDGGEIVLVEFFPTGDLVISFSDKRYGSCTNIDFYRFNLILNGLFY